MNNCLDVLNAQQVIQNKIEIKYKMKQQLPGCIIHSTRYSSKIEINHQITERLPGCSKSSALYSK